MPLVPGEDELVDQLRQAGYKAVNTTNLLPVIADGWSAERLGDSNRKGRKCMLSA